MLSSELARVGEENVKEYTLKLAVVADEPAALYAEDIHAHLLHKERTHPIGPIAANSYITAPIRKIIIEWMIEAHLELGLREETLYMAIDVFDRFLAARAVARTQAQLVSMAALLIACKYEEECCPFIRDIVYFCDGTYSCAQLRDMESLVLNALHFEVCNVTIVPFLARYHSESVAQSKLRHYLAQTALLNGNTMLPSALAAACVSLDKTLVALIANNPPGIRQKFAFLDALLPKC